MSLVPFLLMLAAGGQAAEPVPRTALFCQLVVGTENPEVKSLHMLLSGTVDEVDEHAPIETFDPSGLLGGARFTRFVRHPESDPGFSLLTGSATVPDTQLLVVLDRGVQEFGAALGAAGVLEPLYTGQCLLLQSADTAADFHSINASRSGQ